MARSQDGPSLFRMSSGKVHVPQVGVHAVDHCDMTCPGCDHAAPSAERRSHEPEEYAKHIDRLADYCRAEVFKVTGGEPMLHPDLPGFVRGIRKAADRLSGRIVLTTNGSRVARALGGGERPPDPGPVHAVEVSIHPDLAALIDVKAERPGFGAMADVYGVDVKARMYPAFRLPGFRDEPWTRGSCPASNCLHVLSDGKLARCAIIGFYSVTKGASRGFLQNRDSGLFSIEGGAASSLLEWLSRLPECCRWCSYGEGTVKHWKG